MTVPVGIPIANLPAAGAITGAELVPLSQNGLTVQAPLSTIIPPEFLPQVANSFFAGPVTGAAALPTFRAMVAADVPAITGDATASAGTLNTTVVKLQGRAVAATAPTDTQVLAWNAGASQWQPSSQTPVFGTQVKNTVFSGPASGVDATPTFRALVGADLPNPSATTLGGIQSAAAVTHQWINSISTSGVPALSQPAASDLSNGVTGTGAVVLANTPTLITPVLGVATASSINKVAITAPATSATLTIADGKTLTQSNTLTYTGTDGSTVNFGAGGTVSYGSGSITLTGDVTGTGTSPITTTVAKIAGTTVSGTTGTSNVVFSNSPTLVTPVLGVATASSINGLTLTASTGTLTIANLKTLTVSNTLTFTGTDGSSVAFGTGGTVLYSGSVVNQSTNGPTYQIFTSGSAATYTTPAGVKSITVRFVGAGGGGAGAGATTAPTGGTGGDTIFNSIHAAGGLGGTSNNGAGGAGGSAGTGTATLRVSGATGGGGSAVSGAGMNGYGASAPFFGGGAPSSVTQTITGATAVANTGGGGAGAGGTAAVFGAGGGGGSGEYAELVINNPAGTYIYTVGAAGAGGIGTGTGAATGGAGAAGRIIVEERYNY